MTPAEIIEFIAGSTGEPVTVTFTPFTQKVSAFGPWRVESGHAGAWSHALPPTWDHVMLNTYMRPTGRLMTGDTKTTGRHQTAGSTGLSGLSSITGYACACPTPNAPTRPAVILDPFGGTGTVALVARALGRTGISLDLSADYSRLAQWRIFHSGHASKTRQRTNSERQGTLM